MAILEPGTESLSSTAVQDFLAGCADPVQSSDEVSERTLWAAHGPAIWRAKRFRGSPAFYPVYRCGDLYSHSPLPLLLHKGTLRVHRASARRLNRPGFLYAAGRRTIDRDIVHLGGPVWPRFSIVSALDYASQLASALRLDIAEVEAQHPGYVNIVLCGGKDSLTLLLLPWKNPVVVASAAPNHELVVPFVRAHRPGTEVVRLEDDDMSLLPLEILANSCRNDLQHCRWGPDLRRLAQRFDGRVVFWKGQLGEALMTPTWTKWCHPPYALTDAIRTICRPLRGHGALSVHKFLQRTGVTQAIFFASLWYRGAMWQGAHMSMLRQLTGALVLSGYHGPAVRRVIARVDLRSAVREDIRPLVGEILYGGPVRYPVTNPAPPISHRRREACGLAPFIRELGALGVRVMT